MGEEIMTTHSGSLRGLFGSQEKTPQETEDQTAATTGGNLDQEPVVVWEAANNMEAQIVKGRLESEGIPAFIRGEALGTIFGLTAGSLAATDVLVPYALADQAIDLLHDDADPAAEPKDANGEDHGTDQ